MITGLDHIVALGSQEGASDLLTVLGRTPDDVYEYDDGRRTGIVSFANTTLELMMPGEIGSGSDRVRELMENGEALASLAFATDDLDDVHRQAERRGLKPGEPGTGIGSDFIRCDNEVCGGIRTFIVKPKRTNSINHDPPPASSVSWLDHVVVNTPNPERALAHYGARLGLRLALDRTNPDWGSRLIFFRTGGLTIEILHRLDDTQDPSGPDALWGLSWGVQDIRAAQGRLSDAGIDVSQVRTGRKPGTEVCTVRSHALGIPTLFIAKSAR